MESEKAFGGRIISANEPGTNIYHVNQVTPDMRRGNRIVRIHDSSIDGLESRFTGQVMLYPNKVSRISSIAKGIRRIIGR